MEAQLEQLGNRGMYQDISISKASNTFAFENHNIRITSTDGNTSLSITNEKGPKEIQVSVVLPNAPLISKPLEGKYLGHCVLNKYLIIFTHAEDYDYIYRLNTEFKGIVLYRGNLNFTSEIEAIGYYETNDIQKVYWVDGINPNRVINIVKPIKQNEGDNQFDFNPSVKDFPTVNIYKKYNGIGLFPAGVIQYYITYYNKFGAETGIVYSSDIQYINYQDRAGSPEDVITCNFELDINNIDTSFEYLRVYSCKRTSLNGEPIFQVVGDYPITKSTITVVDNNVNQRTEDPTMLFFLGGNTFKASTIEQKDDTLFLGNISIDETIIDSTIEQALKNTIRGGYESTLINFKGDTIDSTKPEGYYAYKFQTTEGSNIFKGFKRGETYRFGIQFQTHKGFWLNPVWIGDKKVINPPIQNGNEIVHTNARIDLSSLGEDMYTYIQNTYPNYRVVIAETNSLNRSVVAQGIVCPTMFNYKQRVENSPYAISSWFMRPRNGKLSWQHLDNTKVNTDEYSEIQMLDEVKKPYITKDESPYLGYVISICCNNHGYLSISVTNSNSTYEEVKDSNIYSAQTWYDIVAHHKDGVKNTLENIAESYGIKLPFTDEDYNLIINGKKPTTGIILDAIYPRNFRERMLSSWNIEVDETDPNKIEEAQQAALPEGWFSLYYNRDAQTDFITDLNYKKDAYFIDSSIVTFHSPDLEENQDIIDNSNLKFRIVGVAPITSSYSNMDMNLKTSGIADDASITKFITNYPNLSTESTTLASGLFYKDIEWYLKSGKVDDDTAKYSVANNNNRVYYRVHAWNKQGSIINQPKEATKKDIELETLYAELQDKTFATQLFSYTTEYFKNNEIQAIQISNPLIYNSDFNEIKKLNLWGKEIYYQGNYDYLVTTENGYKIVNNNPTGTIVKQYDPIRIKYNTTTHTVFGLINSKGGRAILPKLNNEEDSNIENLYNIEESTVRFPWLDNTADTYTESSISFEPTYKDYPYLYIGELYRDIPQDILYGGTSEDAIEQIRWIPSSKSTSTSKSIECIEGDTYFQRWDCLKTYPATEEDMNKIVDITSVMLETYINLEGRYDKNRGIGNILNARPTNFNLFNKVYSQEDNMFTYNILDEKFKATEYENQIVFSLSKTANEDIDTWTNITLSSVFNLNGSYGKLNKIINYNNSLITFQERAISVIDFNSRVALSTEQGVPIELSNNGKVQGYRVISDSMGTNNSNAICVCATGVYFIDYNSHTLYKFNSEGTSDISSNGMTQWFKDNLTGNEKLMYDSITKDLYIINENVCLVYNEILKSFVSFMDYENMQSLFNLDNKSLAFYNNKLYQMFEGEYNKSFDKSMNYSVEYRVNKEPFTTKIFTNVEYIADCFNSEDRKDNKLPFNKLSVWNEYQKGECNITSNNQKFRLWRVDVPRDSFSKYGLDRIRNPWIHLKLENTQSPNVKTVLHSLLVKYFK